MPEAVTGYPKWQGELSGAPRVWTIMREELLKIYRNKWTGYALAGFLALSILGFAGQRVGASRLENLIDSLKLIEWGALAVVAIAAGPAILDDKRKDALELYLSRSVKMSHYLVAKMLAVWIAAFVIVLVPALAFYLGALVTVDDLAAPWHWAWLGLIGHSAIWATVISGLGMGLTGVLNSSRAASIVLFSVVFGLDVVLSELLEGITRNTDFQVISPIASLHQQNEWLFLDTTGPYGFPWWWGLIVLAGLSVAGWTLFALKHPRIKGVE